MTRALLRHDLPLFALALVSLLPVTVAELGFVDLDYHAQAGAFLQMAVVAAVIGLFLPRDRPPGRFRVWLNRLLVLGVVAYAAIEILKYNQIPVIALSHFVTGLCCVKFMDVSVPRDRYVIVVICLLLLVIGAMISSSILFGLVLLLHLTVGLFWLLRFLVLAESHDVWRRTCEGLRPLRLDLPPVAMPQVSRLRLLALGCAYGAAIVLVAGWVFLSVPRDLLRQRFLPPMPAAITSFTTQVGLDDLGRTLESEQYVMRVQLRLDGKEIGGDDASYYLRGATLERYEKGRWKHTQSVRGETIRFTDRKFKHNVSPKLEWRDRPDRLEQNIWLDTIDPHEQYLYTVFPAIEIETVDIEAARVDPTDRTLRLQPGRSLGSGVRYRVISPLTLDPVFYRSTDRNAKPTPDEDWTDALRNLSSPLVGGAMGRQVEQMWPGLSHRVEDLARTIAGIGQGSLPASRHERAVNAICEYLRNGRYAYTLSAERPQPGEDPTEAFLFRTQKGYCTHFASAMTLMCQSLGIPARMVLGYRTGDYNELAGYYRIQQKHAHTWVEVRLPDRYWQLFDPTPDVAARSRARDASWAALTQRWFDSLEFRWTSLVVSFDAEHRRAMVEGLVDWWRNLTGSRGQSMQWSEWLREVVYGPPEYSTQQRVLYWIVVLLVAAFALLVLRALWVISLIIHERMPRLRRNPRMARRNPQARFYDRLLTLLQRQGIHRPAALTPREFARDLTRRRPDLGGAAQVIEWFYEAQFGNRPISRDRRRAIDRMLEQLRDQGRLEAMQVAGD